MESRIAEGAKIAAKAEKTRSRQQPEEKHRRGAGRRNCAERLSQ